MLAFMAYGREGGLGAHAEQAVMSALCTTDDNGTVLLLDRHKRRTDGTRQFELVYFSKGPRHGFVTTCERILVDEARAVVVNNA